MADQYGQLPGTKPTINPVPLQITEVDWPPAQQHFPDDPADTPGFYDDQNPEINGGGDNDDPAGP